MTELATTSNDDGTDPLRHEGASAADVRATPDTSGIAPPQGPRTKVDLIDAFGLAGLGYPEAKKRLLAEFNDAYVGALLASTSGNMSEAARRSGLDRSNFRRLVRTTSVDAGSAGARNLAKTGSGE